MIGGTYTPVIYRYISTDMALPFLALIWGLVLLGCIFKVFYTGRLKVLSTILYLALGWMVILVAGPLSQALPPRQVFLLELGGGLYSAGVVFYIWKGLPYHHAIWHLFVVAGSTAHFFLIYNSAG
jgi:hemolysin III